MNWLNFFTKLYYKERNMRYLPRWVMVPVRRLTKSIAQKTLPVYLSKPRIVEVKKKVEVVVSLTSFPTRINDVWKVIECMLRQSYQPSIIILWLSKEQFPGKDDIPQSLKEREGDIFQIRLVEGDLRSFKKYYYVSKEYKDSLVFLIDDDIYYPSDIIERAVTALESHPETIICNYGYILKYDEFGRLAKYSEWKKSYKELVDPNIFFGSGGGTLFTPALLDDELTNIEVARKLSPLADDIWLNAIVKISGIPVMLLANGGILPTGIENNVKLASMNISENKNDEQLANVTDYFMDSRGLNPFECKNCK